MSASDCCPSSVPPIVAQGYEPKGRYETIGGLKTYITGLENADMAIIFIYDAFGYAPQTMQGADVLAVAADALVFMPDVFEGGLSHEVVAIRHTPEGKKTLDKFMGEGGPGYLPKVVEQTNSFGASIQSAHPSVKKLGALGFCLGGKAVILASNVVGTPIQASAQGHPSRLSRDDAEALFRPHLILASKDESPEDVKDFDSAKKPAGSEVHTFDDMIHGWMGARADLADKHCREEFKRGYGMTANWLRRVLAS